MNEKLITLSVNGDKINYAPGFKFQDFDSPGSVISQGLDLAIILAGIIMFLMALAGVVQYILAGGDKDGLSKARKRITYSIIGFIITILAFVISDFTKSALPVKDVTVQDITK